MKDTHHLTAELSPIPDPHREPAEEALNLILFQAARELLFNAVKHAGLSCTTVEIRAENGQPWIVGRRSWGWV